MLASLASSVPVAAGQSWSLSNCTAGTALTLMDSWLPASTKAASWTTIASGLACTSVSHHCLALRHEQGQAHDQMPQQVAQLLRRTLLLPPSFSSSSCCSSCCCCCCYCCSLFILLLLLVLVLLRISWWQCCGRCHT